MGSRFVVQAAEQPAHPKSAPRRRPGISSHRCTQIGEQPKNETLQAIFHLYETEHEHAPSRTRDAVDWAINQGLLATPPPIDPCEVLANQMSKALAQELDTHKGHRYRVNHAVRTTKDGKPQSFWAIMGFAPHEHMEKAFAQRREHIVGECAQLNTDVIVYNDMNEGKVPEIQIILDFSEDVAERQQ